MKLFNFNKNKTKTKGNAKKTQAKPKNSPDKAKFGLFKNKDDFIGRSGIGAAVESALITTMQANLSNDEQPYIAIDDQNNLIYLIALTNKLMKGSMFEKDSEALGSLQSAVENSNRNNADDDHHGDVPGSVYNASFQSDIAPEKNEDGETPPKQLVFLPTINTLNELEQIAGPDQEYEIVSLPSDISEINYLDYSDQGKINLPIIADDNDSGQEDNGADIEDLTLKVTISGFKDFVKEHTDLDSSAAYENFDDEDDNTDDQLEDNTDDEALLDDVEDEDEFSNENGDDSDLPEDDFNGTDLDDDQDDSFNDPFDDDLDDSDLDDSDLNTGLDDTEDHEPDTLAEDDSKSKDNDSNNSNNTNLEDMDLDDIDLDDDSDFDDPISIDEDVDDDLDINVPSDNDADTESKNEPEKETKSDDSEQKSTDTESKSEDDVDDSLDDLDDMDDLDDDLDLDDNSQQESDTESPEDDQTEETNTNETTSQESTGSVEPEVSTSAPATPEMTNEPKSTSAVQQQAQDNKFIQNVTNVHSTDEQSAVHPGIANEGEALIDVTNPEVSLSKIDPSIKKMRSLTDSNRKAREQLRAEYSKQIDEWLARNLQVPVLYVKDGARFGKKFLIEQNADNELLRKDVETQRAMIKAKLLNQIDQILDGLTDPSEFDRHFPQVAEELRSKFLNKDRMKKEQIERLNFIEQSYNQIHEGIRSKALEEAENEFNTKYVPQRDKEITNAANDIKAEHQKAHSDAVDKILETAREQAKPLVDEQVKDIILGGQSLIDSAALTISSQTRAYQTDLFKQLTIKEEMDNSNNDLNPSPNMAGNGSPRNENHVEREALLYQKQHDLEHAQNTIAELKRQLHEKENDNENLKAVVNTSHNRETELSDKLKQYQSSLMSIKAEKDAAKELADQYQHTNNSLVDELVNVRNHGRQGDKLSFAPETSVPVDKPMAPIVTPEPATPTVENPKPTVKPEQKTHIPKSSPAHTPQL